MFRAFTLLELLVVMGIMGLLGTISVGGYRAMQRGMEERGAVQNVDSFIRAAYQRAQIDRQPTAIYFWNETVQSSTEDKNEIVVGKAVAIRRYGRLSDVRDGCLIDEFADLNHTYQVADEEEAGGSSREATIYLYPMDKLSDIQAASSLRRSRVEGMVKDTSDSVIFLSGKKDDQNDATENKNEIPSYGFNNDGGVNWKPGMAYGMEFAYLELPDGYVFGNNYSSSAEDPVVGAGTLVFDVGVNSGGGRTTGGTLGRKTIDIYSLRMDGAKLVAKKVATSGDPEQDED